MCLSPSAAKGRLTKKRVEREGGCGGGRGIIRLGLGGVRARCFGRGRVLRKGTLRAGWGFDREVAKKLGVDDFTARILREGIPNKLSCPVMGGVRCLSLLKRLRI